MFDIGWSELLVIAVVLIVVVGPKDLPRMLRTFGRTTSQLRSMASDFRRQFDEALREAELDEMRNTANDIRKLDPTKEVRSALNPMRAISDEIRSSLTAATRAPEPRVPDASEPLKPVDAPAAAAAPASIPGQAPESVAVGSTLSTENAAASRTENPATASRKTEDAA